MFPNLKYTIVYIQRNTARWPCLARFEYTAYIEIVVYTCVYYDLNVGSVFKASQAGPTCGISLDVNNGIF